MPKLSVAVPHALGQDEVVQRLKDESTALKSTFGDQVTDYEESWKDHTLTFSFKTFGMAIEGNVSVEPAQVMTTASVPIAAMMFKGMIETRIRDRLEELLKTNA